MRDKYIRGVLVIFFSVFSFAAGLYAAEDDFFEAKVARVLSGSRIVLRGGTHVEYCGITIPNVHLPAQGVGQLARQARALNKKLVKDKTIRLEFVSVPGDSYYDPDQRKAYVFSSGVFINARLIKEGLAVLNDDMVSGDKYYEYFQKIQKQAMQQKRGVWKVFQ